MYLFLIHYTAPLEKIAEVRPAHRDYLEKFVQSGNLLVSGPRTPATGGVVVAHFASADEAQAFTANDPFTLNGVATYDILEFNPAKLSPQAKAFVEQYGVK